jgi:hypothetical protein
LVSSSINEGKKIPFSRVCKVYIQIRDFSC